MSKKNKTVLNIFAEALGLYFSNFEKFVQYMTFPVMGQLGGLCLIFILVLFYTKSIPTLIEKAPILNDFSILIT